MVKKIERELSDKSKEDLERNKLMLEIDELHKRTKRRFINTIAIAIISIPTIWFYYKEFAEPFMQIDKIELSRELRELKVYYEQELNNVMRKRDELENEKNLLAEEKQKLELQFLALDKQKQQQQKDFQKQLKEIRNEYNKLRSLYKTKTRESEQFKRKVHSLNGQIKEKDELINDLDNNIKQVETKATAKRLRSSPTYLTDVQSLISSNNFYDSKKNPDGKGISNQFTQKKIKGDAVIVDNATGLMWQQEGSDVYLNYDSARERIKELNHKSYAGFGNWRLPTLEEAMSLLESGKSGNGLFIDPIFSRFQIWIWTTDRVSSKSMAWVVDFKYGECVRYDPKHGSYVRAVRSVQ